MDKDIDYVIAVAECKSISKASELLFISQPSLSRYISKLEQQLGLLLFRRNPDGIQLTEAGEIYLAYAKEIRGLRSTMDRKLHQLYEETTHNIRVCMTLNSSFLTTNEMSDKFHKKYPECKLEFSNVMSKDIPFMLKERRYNFAVGPDLSGVEGLVFDRICTDYLVLAVPRTYDFDSLAEEKEGFIYPWLDVSKVKDADFIFQEETCMVRKAINNLLGDIQVTIIPKFVVSNSVLAIQAAERQLGCSFLSETFLSYVMYKKNLKYYCVGREEKYTESGILSLREKVFTPQEKYCISVIKNMLHREKEDIRKEIITINYDE